jgi:quinol-cytochrome oxidoreductase complex cytochrome b subunit
MNTIILLILLGGCLVMHFFMMRRHGHDENHEHTGSNDKENDKNHSGHGCCH